MARPLIVEPNTERLQVVLMRDCSAVDATNVTLTVTRKGETVCFPVLHYADACLPPCRLCDGASPVVAPPPSKTYTAASVVRGIATFAIDHDLTEASAGWYLGRVAAEGCEVAALTIWVRRCGAIGRAVRHSCQQ